MLIKLTKDFFKFQTNSFLHNSFYLLLSTLNNNKKLTIEHLQQMSIFELVIKAFETRDQNYTSSYYGQLSLIALEILNPHSRKYKQLNREQWKTIVMKKVFESHSIQKRDYGGSLLISRINPCFTVRNLILLLTLITFLLVLLRLCFPHMFKMRLARMHDASSRLQVLLHPNFSYHRHFEVHRALPRRIPHRPK